MLIDVVVPPQLLWTLQTVPTVKCLLTWFCADDDVAEALRSTTVADVCVSICVLQGIRLSVSQETCTCRPGKCSYTVVQTVIGAKVTFCWLVRNALAIPCPGRVWAS